MYQYRITVEGQSSGVLSVYPSEQWSTLADTCESRGVNATLERRLVTDPDILELIESTIGYILLGSRVVCPWEVIAEMIMR